MPNPALPVVDDTLVWDAWMAMYRVPAISVALELDIFEALDAEPLGAPDLARRMGYDERGLGALLPMLKLLGFLVCRAGVYSLSEAGRHYMLKASPFYWGGLFRRLAGTIVPHRLLLETINGERAASRAVRPADGWESGHVDMELAREVTAFMHSHSIAAAVGMTRTCDFSQARRLLDVGGGSGCFAIALAHAFPQLSATVMELPTICTLARDYIREAGLEGRVDTRSVDMFRQDWPAGYDAIFFSNIFHDWSMETCSQLARKAFDALPSGGRIFLHEMLLEDGGDGPPAAVAFSLLMAMGTLGQQFTFAQLRELLTQAGFTEVEARQSYGYYSLVSGKKH